MGRRPLMAPRLWLDARGILWLSGPDRLGFLHRLTTAAISDIEPGHGRGTLLLTDAAKVVDVLSVYAGDEGAIAVTSTSGAAEAVGKHMQRYVLYADDVSITDARSQVAVISVLDGADEIADVLAAAGAPVLGVAAASATWRQVEWSGAPIWRLRHTDPGAGGDDLVVPRGPTAEALVEALVEAGVAVASAAQWDAMRVARHLPAFGAEAGGTDAGNPLELGLSELVDFNKGCYLGQEIVARLQTYHKVQRQLVVVSSSLAVARGDVVRRPGSGRGRLDSVVTTVAAPRLGPAKSQDSRQDCRCLALALVPRALEVGDAVEIGPGNLRGEVLWSSAAEGPASSPPALDASADPPL